MYCKEETNENILQFMTNSVDYVNIMERPRIIKSHLPFSMLPEKLLDTCKIIFVSRNVKVRIDEILLSFIHTHSADESFFRMLQFHISIIIK